MLFLKTIMKWQFLLLGLWLISGCETIKPYEKEYLLDPLMDDGGIARLKSDMRATSSARNERLTAGAGASASGSSCPTCGG
jgi:hypothetical protein